MDCAHRSDRALGVDSVKRLNGLQPPPPQFLVNEYRALEGLKGLKELACSGKMPLEYVGIAAGLGETLRLTVSRDMGHSDRSAELVYIMGCIMSDPGFPPQMAPKFKELIRAVDSGVFITQRKGEQRASDFFDEVISFLCKEGDQYKYRAAHCEARLKQVRDLPHLRMPKKGEVLCHFEGAMRASINNGLMGLLAPLMLMSYESP